MDFCKNNGKRTHKYNPISHRASIEPKKWEIKHTGPVSLEFPFSVCAAEPLASHRQSHDSMHYDLMGFDSFPKTQSSLHPHRKKKKVNAFL